MKKSDTLLTPSDAQHLAVALGDTGIPPDRREAFAGRVLGMTVWFLADLTHGEAERVRRAAVSEYQLAEREREWARAQTEHTLSPQQLQAQAAEWLGL